MKNEVKNMETVEIVMELEGGELIINDFEDLERLKDVCKIFAGSQGFYGRLLNCIEENEANISENDFPIYF